MKIDRLIAAFAFVLALAVSPVLAQPKTAASAPAQSTANVPESKIALIYSDAFLDPKTGINRFTTLISNLNREFQPRQTELQSLQGKIQALTDDIAKTTTVADPKTIALKQEQLDQLRALDHAATKLRDQLGVSGIGEVIWRARDLESDMLVEADGYGGAKIVVVEGNYPLDYLVIREQVVKTYLAGRLLAAKETGIAFGLFPEECPFTPEQVLDLEFFPEDRSIE